jgi:hypothetical protein
MLSRIKTALLILAAVVVCSTTLAVESAPVGAKATMEEPQPGSEVAVPATNEWGMLVMVLLVLTASTAAMLGGGFPSRIVQSMPTPSPTPPAPSAEPQPKRRSSRFPGSPKNKSKRPFSHQRSSRAQAGNDAGQSARRTNLSRSRRRREGPGCRGIR